MPCPSQKPNSSVSTAKKYNSNLLLSIISVFVKTQELIAKLTEYRI